MSRYWLTPPELHSLRDGRFDPCPWPRESWDGLEIKWPKPWYCNPPFSAAAKWTRKAIEQGGPGTLVIPTTTPTALVIQKGLQLEYLGEVQWRDVDTFAYMPRSRAPPCIKVVFP